MNFIEIKNVDWNIEKYTVFPTMNHKDYYAMDSSSLQGLGNSNGLEIEYSYATYAKYHVVLLMRFDSKEDFLIWKLGGCTQSFLETSDFVEISGYRQEMDYSNKLYIKNYIRVPYSGFFPLDNGLMAYPSLLSKPNNNLFIIE